MAIVTKKYDSQGKLVSVTETHKGQVIEVRRGTENRNTSDTLDYTDFRDVPVQYALVRTKHGIPHPTRRHPGYYPSSYGSAARDLEPHEQFFWLDCSNTFSYRTGEVAQVEQDADLGDRELQAALAAWHAHLDRVEAAERAEAEKRRLEKVAQAEKEKARQLVIQAKEEAARKKAEADLASAPARGASVRIGDFAGHVFWAGVKKFRGKYNARLGVKDASGNVVWCNAEEAKPA